MLTVIETWQATDTWLAIRQSGKAGTSVETLRDLPMYDEMMGVFGSVMAEIREARQRTAQEEAERVQETE